MVNFVAAQALAKKLIEANGRDITLIKLSEVPADTSKPWRGPTSAAVFLPGTPDPTVVVKKGYTTKAVFVKSETEMGMDFADATGTLVRNGELAFLIPAVDLEPEEVEEFDSIDDGGRTWKIIDVDLLKPGPLRIMYVLKVTG